MAEVNFSNLFSEPRNNVLTILNSDVSDPTTSSAEFRKWIYSREPDVKDNDFSGYPFIILHPNRFDSLPGGTMGGKKKPTSFTMDIQIITSDRGYAGNDGQGLSHMDTISNSIATALINITNRKSLLYTSNQRSITFLTSSVLTRDLSNELVYDRTITVSFNLIKAVSA